LTQDVSLTDGLKEAPVSELPLNEAIEKALENRNEIHGSVFNLKNAEFSLRQIRGISSTAARHLEVSARLLRAEADHENEPKNIERDVRQKYMNMIQKKAEAELGRQNAEHAKEAHHIAERRFEAGLTTLAEVRQAQLASFRAELAYSAALLEYNLSITDYEQSATVGVVSVSF